MTRRAVIYIRTSSETQSEKSGSVEQETDCLSVAQEKGLKIVRVYRDVEKYGAGNKLVEPSGNRSHRPGLLAMLKDAARDEKVSQLQKDYKQMQEEEMQLQEEIKKLTAERQEFITKAHKEHMSDEEFIPQVGVLYDKKLGVKRKLTAIEQGKDVLQSLIWKNR